MIDKLRSDERKREVSELLALVREWPSTRRRCARALGYFVTDAAICAVVVGVVLWPLSKLLQTHEDDS